MLQHQLDELQTLLVKFDQNRPIHTIDVDIFMSKIRNLYEETGLLFNIDSKSDVPAPEPAPSIPRPQAVHPPPVKKITAPPPIQTPKTPVQAPAPPVQRPPTSQAQFIIPQTPKPTTHTHTHTPKPTSPTPTPTHTPTPNPTLGDHLKASGSAVNEIYGKAKGSTKTTSNPQPVTDILVAIGLNDRFMYTRELFNNDSGMFKSTITVLNNLPNFDAAQEYLKKTFNWKDEDANAEQFVQIVRRRYL